MTANPAFVAYALTCIVLTLEPARALDFERRATGTGWRAINPEDGARYGVPVSDMEPPAVARYLRAHRNAEAVIYPFLFVGVVYVLAGGGAALAIPIFSVFAVARIAHAIVYLRALQPWRTITFVLSLLALLALILSTLYVLLSR